MELRIKEKITVICPVCGKPIRFSPTCMTGEPAFTCGCNSKKEQKDDS